MSTFPAIARRLFLSRSSQLTLSAATVGLLAGTGGIARAQSSTPASADVNILNVALGLSAGRRQRSAALSFGA